MLSVFTLLLSVPIEEEAEMIERDEKKWGENVLNENCIIVSHHSDSLLSYLIILTSSNHFNLTKTVRRLQTHNMASIPGHRFGPD